MIYLDQAEIFNTEAVTDLERRMACYLGVDDAVAVDHGTSALHLALLEAGVNWGDEVIVPVLTFAATAHAVTYTGAKPVFVDVDRQTWCIDPAEVVNAITERTKVIIPVHLYGNPCDMDAIMEIAESHNLIVIEDACQSLGATYNGNQTGTIGHYGCFSFNSNKVISADGGGLVVGQYLPHIRYMANQAKNKDGTHGKNGHNYRMSSLLAEHLLLRMVYIGDALWKKGDIAFEYAKQLHRIGIDWQHQHLRAKVYPSFWYTPILLPHGTNISNLQAKLKRELAPDQELDITRRIFRPLTDSAPYYERKVYESAQYVYDHGLCLPVSVMNRDGVIERVCEIIKGEI